MKFVYLFILANVSALLSNRDIYSNLYIDEGVFGSNVKNYDACDTWHKDCHTCVSAGCEYNSVNQHCYLPGGRDDVHHVPRFENFFERA